MNHYEPEDFWTEEPDLIAILRFNAEGGDPTPTLTPSASDRIVRIYDDALYRLALLSSQRAEMNLLCVISRRLNIWQPGAMICATAYDRGWRIVRALDMALGPAHCRRMSMVERARIANERRTTWSVR